MKRIKRQPAILFLLGGFFILTLWLVVKGWRIQKIVSSLQVHQVEAETLLAGGFANFEPNSVQALVSGIRLDVVELKAETAVFMPIVPHLRWVPRLGPTLSAVPQLMEMIDAGSETAVYASSTFLPALEAYTDNLPITELLPNLIQQIEGNSPTITAMNHSFDRMMDARQELGDIRTLPWRIRKPIEQFDAWLPLAQSGLKFIPVLPELLGFDGPQRYLILTQNEDELRPTGGFISGAGLLIVENGRIVDLSFQDSYLVDNWRAKPYDFPPQPFYDFMGLELFLFRDANFWPDFPTSAEKAMDLYSYGQDMPPLAGTIAIDQRFLQLLVAAIGPVEIADAGLTLTANNLIETMQAAWSNQEEQDISEWFTSRKDFINLFATAILNRLETNIDTIDPQTLAKTLMTAVSNKHLQVYFRDPKVAAIVNSVQIDGRLPQNPDHDFLMAVDTNMSYSKVNLLIERSILYEVDIHADRSAKAITTITHQHKGDQIKGPCNHGAVYNLETSTSYENLVNTCYWNYLRIYLPAGSRLDASTQHQVLGENLMSGKTWESYAQTVEEFSGLTTFANFMLIKPGQTVTSSMTYQLPANIVQTDGIDNHYRLVIQKQAGTIAQRMNVVLSFPRGAELREVVPNPTMIDGATLHFAFELDKNSEIEVNYR